MFASRSSVALLIALVACGDHEAPAQTALSREQLLDPATCKSCHPQHYREWASSMHAYASEDPVFAAMNARGQRETNGALGDFCVRCHAPMALRDGFTQDGLSLASAPQPLRGVTCYFCHQAIATEAGVNNHVTLAEDGVMRGGIADVVETPVHGAAYSALHDRNAAESSQLCGSCHDVTTPNGIAVERTFQEYQESIFGKPGPGFDTCSGCHMIGKDGKAATGDVPVRKLHEHLWPGVDTAHTEFPDRAAQLAAVKCALGSNTLVRGVSLSPLGELIVKLETQAGHHQPSGASHDRRMWLEVKAYDANDQLLFQSGVIADGEREEKMAGEPGFDPQLALFRDWLYDAQGQYVKFMWQAARSSSFPRGFNQLTLPSTLILGVAHTLDARYQLPDAARVERVRIRLRMRAVGVDVLEELVASGDLDPAVIAQQPTFTIFGAAVDWRPRDNSLRPLVEEQLACPDAYECLLGQDAGSCP
jgi:hypothetical protein